MPEVRFMIFCEKLQPNENGQPVIVNPYIRISPIIFPSLYTFTLVIGIDELNPAEKYEFRIKISDPDGEELANREFPFQIPAQDANVTIPIHADKTVSMMTSLELTNFPLRKEGYYSAELIYKNKILGQTKVFISKQERGNNGRQ